MTSEGSRDMSTRRLLLSAALFVPLAIAGSLAGSPAQAEDAAAAPDADADAGSRRAPGVPAEAAPPPPPRLPRVRPDILARPSLEWDQLLDPRGLATRTPDAWCPSPDADFRAWLEEREALARRSGTPKTLGIAAPRLNVRDGVVVIEDDGTLTRRDRPPDVSGASVLFEPDGAGYSHRPVPLAWDGDIGDQIFSDRRNWHSEPIDLTALALDFGGETRARVWITSAFGIHFEEPSAPGSPQLLLRDALADRSPRVAPLQQGGSLAGRNAFVRESADRLVVTWQVTDGPLDVDVQSTLFADGRILFSYASLAEIRHGAPLVVTGNDAWWADLRAVAAATDPPGEVTDVSSPTSLAIDQVALRVAQVADSELVHVEVEMEAAPPADTDGQITFALELRAEEGGPVLQATYAAWADGAWRYRSAPVEWDGAVARFSFLLSESGLGPSTLHATAWTGRNWAWKDTTLAEGALPAAPPQPLMRDFTDEIGVAQGGPLIEAFTLPELLPGRVRDVVAEEMGDPRYDGLAIYQTFRTDIVFYAGAYSTVGNAGADGIGSGSSTEPEAPALLHMNAIRYGWNSWDAGKITVLNHEFGHHWLYFFRIDEGAGPERPLNPGGGHPAGWVHAPAAAPIVGPDDASCMGGSTWTDNGDGTFTSPPGFVSNGYSWHELYLMGLAEVGEVEAAGDWWYLRDSDPALPGAYWPPGDTTVTATRVPVTLDQLVAAEGPRVPAAPDSRRDFVVPMVLVTRPGEARPEDVAEVARTCEIWRPAFEAATLERATLTCDRVGRRAPNAVIVEPASDITIEIGTSLEVLGRGTDPDRDAVTLTWDFDGVAPAADGPGRHAVRFDTLGTYTLRLDATDTTGDSDETPATRTITVTCATPDELDGLRVAREAGGIRLTWAPPATPVDESLALASSTPGGAFVEAAAGSVAGDVGLALAPEPGLRFYRVRGRNLPDCVGP